MAEWVKVAPAAAFPAGERRLIDVGDIMIAVFNIDGDFYAVEDVCSHDGGSLDDAVVENCEIICPRHGARFCLKTGAPLSPPAYEPIASFPVRVADEYVWVKDDRSD